jgi:hypothetical protein
MKKVLCENVKCGKVELIDFVVVKNGKTYCSDCRGGK